MKILFATDLHLSSSSPRSRKDDYASAMILKLMQLRDLCRLEGVSALVIGGDIFHNPRQPYSFTNSVAHVFRTFQVPIYTIVGNHDVLYGKFENVSKSPLGTLIVTGVMQMLPHGAPVTLTDGVRLWGYHYTQNLEIPPLKKISGGKDIVVFHQYVTGGEGIFEPEDFIKVESLRGYDMALVGHDHVEYPALMVEGCNVIRPGSLSRGTKHHYNRLRDVFASMIDLKDLSLQKYKLNVASADEIYSSEQINREKLPSQLLAFVESLKKRLSSNVSLREVVAQMPGSDEVKATVLKYFSDYNLC